MPPTILLTRPEAQARRLQRELAALGLEACCVVSPVIEIAPRPVVPPGRDYAAALLTSANAARFVPPGIARALCVGDRTAEAAREAGLEAVSAGGDVAALAALVRAEPPGGPVLHVRGAHSAGSLVERLRAAGVEADEVVAYDQAARPLSDEAAALLASEAEVVAPLYSPRSARLVSAHPGPWRATLRVVALSAAVAAAWSRDAASVAIAATPEGEAMLDAILEACGRARAPRSTRLVDRDGPG